jgi:hypothetical protein
LHIVAGDPLGKGGLQETDDLAQEGIDTHITSRCNQAG